MKRFKIIALWILAGGWLAACETVVPVEIPGVPDRLVVNSLYEIGQPWQVEVSASRHILSNEVYAWIDNATLTLFADGQQVVAVTGGDEGRYELGYSPEVGVAYRLEISAPNYTTAEVYTSVMDESQFVELRIDSAIDNSQSYYETTYPAKVRVRDAAGVKNSYNLRLMAFFPEGMGYPIDYENPDLGTVDSTWHWMYWPNSSEFSAIYWDEPGIHTKDDLFDGREVTLEAHFRHYDGEQGYEKYILEARSLNEDYRLFMESLSLQRETEGNPFAQPVPVYSNVEDGLGIVAGYRAIRYEFTL